MWRVSLMDNMFIAVGTEGTWWIEQLLRRTGDWSLNVAKNAIIIGIYLEVEGVCMLRCFSRESRLEWGASPITCFGKTIAATSEDYQNEQTFIYCKIGTSGYLDLASFYFSHFVIQTFCRLLMRFIFPTTMQIHILDNLVHSWRIKIED